jgi:hypothetical protein
MPRRRRCKVVRDGISKNSKRGNTIVRSTIDGMVLDVPVKEGNSVIERNNFNEGTTIATIADMKDLIFQGKVDESEVGKVKLGMPVVLTVGAIENATWDAESGIHRAQRRGRERRHPVRDPRSGESEGRPDPAQRATVPTRTSCWTAATVC